MKFCLYCKQFNHHAIYDWLHYWCGEWEGWAPVNRFNHTSGVNAVTPTDRPKLVRSCFVIKVFMLSRCFLDFSVGVVAFEWIRDRLKSIWDRLNSIWVSEIGCLTSHWTIFQLYMWRHIDVQADWRRSWTYGRAPNAIDISQGSLTCPSKHRHGTTLFIRWFRHTAPISRLLRSRWGYGGHILNLNPRALTGGIQFEKGKIITLDFQK